MAMVVTVLLALHGLVLHTFGWVCFESLLTKRHQPLHSLDKGQVDRLACLQYTALKYGPFNPTPHPAPHPEIWPIQSSPWNAFPLNPLKCDHLATPLHVRRVSTAIKWPPHTLIHMHVHTWMYFRCVSSLSTCAICCEKIFSLPVLAWIPTMVTPMGHGALPIAIDR